jgi:hypothetical protein
MVTPEEWLAEEVYDLRKELAEVKLERDALARRVRELEEAAEGSRECPRHNFVTVADGSRTECCHCGWPGE